MPLSDDEKEVEEEEENSAKTETTSTTNAPSSSSWVHRNLQKSHVHASKASTYSAVERNPLFAGAEKTNNWELSTLTLHYHPSAALFAKTIVDAEPVRNYIEIAYIYSDHMKLTGLDLKHRMPKIKSY